MKPRTSGLQNHIYTRMQEKDTQELITIWVRNDHTEWSDEAFNVIESILLEKLGSLPAQDSHVTDRGNYMPEGNDRGQLAELLGGLSLTPYGIYWALSAFAFAVGWLNWETNGGPPFLGVLLAYLFDRLIRFYYHKKYNYSFAAAPSKTDNSSTRKAIITVLVVATLVVAWVIEKYIPLPMRLVLFLFGILGACRRAPDLGRVTSTYRDKRAPDHHMWGYSVPLESLSDSLLVTWRGITWTRKGWGSYGLIHSWLGILLMGASVVPLALNIPPYDMYFGVDGILEMALLGLAIIMIGVTEHLIIVKVSSFKVTL